MLSALLFLRQIIIIKIIAIRNSNYNNNKWINKIIIIIIIIIKITIVVQLNQN